MMVERIQDMPNRDDFKRMELRLTDLLHEILKERADKNGRTLHSEILITLEKSATASKRILKTKSPSQVG
jgi:hypothetical protein